MGEAPAFFPDDLQRDFDGVCDFRSKGNQTATIVGNKTYVIGETDDDPKSTVGVRVFNKCTREWSIPTVLGTRPELFKDLSALLVNEDRILVVQGNSRCEDCIWFLEVDTSYVREQKKTFETEVVAWSKGIVGNVGKPIVVSGPSGVGKGTLIAKLMKDFPSMFGFSVSHTTRAPRDKETNGFHYHFTERSVMEKEIKDGKFLEFASVHGNLYGTSIEAVEVVADAGKRCILDIDVQGARSVRASPLEAVFIFICPPSLEELEKRLCARGTETEEQIQRRLCNAKAELEQGKATGLFDHILVNDDLDACYESLKKILGLHEGAVTADLSSPKLNLPTIYSLAKVNHKILVNYGLAPTEKLSKDLFVMDLSSLKGGAPGQTRGINIYSVDNFENGMNGFEGLS